MRRLLIGSVLALVSSLAGADNAAVGTLETNSHKVVIGIKASKPVYTVYDNQGRQLARELEREQLFARFPALKALIDRGVAKDASLEQGKRTVILKRENP